MGVWRPWAEIEREEEEREERRAQGRERRREEEGAVGEDKI